MFSIVSAVIIGAMLVTFITLLIGLFLPNRSDPIFGGPIISPVRKAVTWLPALGGLGAGIYIIFGPLIEIGSGASGHMVIQHVSFYQEHFEHAGVLPALLLLYFSVLGFIGRLTLRGYKRLVAISAIVLMVLAVFSASPLFFFVPELLLALILALWPIRQQVYHD